MGIIVRQSIKGTIANYIGIAVGFVTTFFVLTRFLTAEEIGLTRVLIDTATLLASLSQLGTNSSIIRYYPYFKDADKHDHGFFFWTLVVPLIGFAIFATLYVLLRAPIEQAFAEKSALFNEYYLAVLPLAFFMLYMGVFEFNSNVLMRIVVPKITREVVVRVLALGTYLLYAFRAVDLTQFVIVFCSIYGVATLINVVYLFSLQKVSLKPDFSHITKALAKDYLLYTGFLVISAFATAITPVVSTFFISSQQGLAFTGIFAIATYIAAVIEIPYRSLSAIAQPQISQTIKDNDIVGANRLCQSVSLHQLIVGSLIFFVIWINIDLFFAILPNGNTYQAAKWVVFILGLSRLVNSVLGIGATVLNYSKYYYFSLIFAFVQTTFAIAFNNFMIPIWGINGAASATLCAYLVYYIALLILVKWRVKTSPFSWNQAKIVGLMLVLFVINSLWTLLIGDYLAANSLLVQIVEAVIRTSILCLLATLAIYKSHVSAEINGLIEQMLGRFRR